MSFRVLIRWGITIPTVVESNKQQELQKKIFWDLAQYHYKSPNWTLCIRNSTSVSACCDQCQVSRVWWLKHECNECCGTTQDSIWHCRKYEHVWRNGCEPHGAWSQVRMQSHIFIFAIIKASRNDHQFQQMAHRNIRIFSKQSLQNPNVTHSILTFLNRKIVLPNLVSITSPLGNLIIGSWLHNRYSIALGKFSR